MCWLCNQLELSGNFQECGLTEFARKFFSERIVKVQVSFFVCVLVWKIKKLLVTQRLLWLVWLGCCCLYIIWLMDMWTGKNLCVVTSLCANLRLPLLRFWLMSKCIVMIRWPVLINGCLNVNQRNDIICVIFWPYSGLQMSLIDVGFR